MKSKKPLTEKQLAAFESRRNVAEELRRSVREMIAGKGKKVEIPPVVAARMRSGLSQAQFAKLLGVSARTLQEWEQGRRAPSRAAQVLIAIEERRPDLLREIGEEMARVL